MNLQTQPNRWSCSVTAFSIALDVPVEELISHIGHDGSQTIFPCLPEPACRRGFHPNEILIVAYGKYGKSFMPLEVSPAIQSPVGDTYKLNRVDAIVDPILRNQKGVLECQGTSMHMVAFKWGEVYDPQGHQYYFNQLANHGLRPYKFWVMR
jgi:hypothetical protein